nr:hypothetical protein [Tanacetum cinerariifolium]
MSKSKILVVGGTWYIGKRIVKASLDQGHPTYVFMRRELGFEIEKLQMLLSFKKQGAYLVEGSYSDHQSLVDVVKQVDVVICTISRVQFRSHHILLQLKLVDAIKEAGNIMRFLPSEFRLDPSRTESDVEYGKETFEDKMVIRKAIEDAKIPYTYISANCLGGYFVGNLAQLGSLIPPKDRVSIYGDGNCKGPSPSTPSSLYKEIVVIRSSNQVVANQLLQVVSEPRSRRVSSVWATRFTTTNYLAFRFVNDKVAAGGYRQNCRELKGIVKLRFFRLEDKQPEEKTNTDCLRSTQQYKKSGVAKHLGVARIQQQNGLVDETNVTFFAKVVLYRNMGFNKSEEYKKTFIGFGVGTGSMQVLHGFKFEVEPLGDHTFEVEPQENVDQGAGLQEVQTQDLIYYQLARDREQHLACELFGYREYSNEVISKWKAELKDDMDARSDVYVLSNSCMKCSDDIDGYYWEYTPGMFIHLFLYIDDMVFSCGCKAEIWATKGLLDKAKGNVLGMKIARDHSGYTSRVSQSRSYNRKLVQTLLERHFILSLKGSLSRDCDVEKNDVGMLDGFDRGLQTYVHVFMDFDFAMGRSITRSGRVSSVWATRFATTNYLAFRFMNDKVAAGGYRQVKVLKFFDCPGPRRGVEDLRELLHKVLCLIRCCEVYITRLSE